MPKINITDTDLTTAVGSITSSYGVFVPGLAGVEASVNIPVKAKEYTSLSAFKADVGSAPVTLGSNFTDLGYMYACELLGAGLPVIYKVVPIVTTLSRQTDEFETFTNGTTALTEQVAENTQPGTTNLVDAISFYIGEDEIAWPNDTVITVGSDKVVTIETTIGSGIDISSITSAVYNYEPEGYVDPTTITYKDICNAILSDTDFFGEIVDRGLYDVSFVTTGGYPTIWEEGTTTKSLAPSLTAVAAARGDCFALVDLDMDIKIEFESGKMVSINALKLETVPQDAFSIAPWEEFTPNYSGVTQNYFFPGSFAYLKAFAGSIKTNNSWFATAGVRRGSVACSGVSQIITNAEADAMQPAEGISVNAITYIKPYGYVIYGNRTLFPNSSVGLVANSFINVRQLVHDIKRNVYSVCKSLMFDPNDDKLWVNFRNAVTPLLEKMRSGQGISSYRLVHVKSSARGTMTAKIIIAPIEAVETFNITVELTDEDVAVVG